MEKIKGTKPANVDEGSKNLKKVKEKLSKIRIDESFIINREKQLVEEGYAEEEAKSVASKEAMIKTDNDRITLYKENPELKDAEEMINKILIKRDASQREVNDILKKGTETKEIKSNRQALREAEDRLRNLSIDTNIVKQEKTSLLNEGYPFDFSEKISNINGEIRLLQNKIQIIIENPKIENGLKLKKALEEKLVKLEGERNNILTSKPDPVKMDSSTDKNTEIKEEGVKDEYDELNIEEEIKNTIGEKVIEPEKQKSDKKSNWSKLNPLSWFKRKEKLEDINSNIADENKNRKFIVGITGGAPAFLDQEIIEPKNKDKEDIGKIIDEKIEKEKNKIILSHTGASPAFGENKIAEDKKEKKKTLYTKEEQEAFYTNLKERLTKGEISEMQFKEEILKRTEEIHNFEKGSVYKAMDKWDKWGEKGGVGKYAKMAINIAMIAGISSLTVNGITGLSERVLSRTLMGTGVGVGMGGLMTFLDRLPPEKKTKIQKIIKGSLIGGSAIFAIASGGILPGIAIGASAAVGYGVSTYVKNFTKKDLEKEIDYFKESIRVDIENIDKNISTIEYQIKEGLKDIDRSKLIAKSLEAIVAVSVSGLTLTTSELVNVLSDDNSNIETDDDQTSNNEKEEDNVKITTEENNTPETKPEDNKNEDVKTEDANKNTTTEDDKSREVKPEEKTKTPETDGNKSPDTKTEDESKKVESKPEEDKTTEQKTETPKSYVGEKEVGAVADKGQGAISTIKELKADLAENYKDIPADDIPKNVKHILDTNENELAKEYGLYRPGEEAESAKVFSGDKITFDQETGEVKFHQAKTGEDIVLEKGKVYGGDMFDSGKLKDSTVEIKTENTGGETFQSSPKDESYAERYSEENNKFTNKDIVIDGEEIKQPQPEVSQKEIVDMEKYAQSYGLDVGKEPGETDSDYMDRMKDLVAGEKESLKSEMIANEKLTLNQTLKNVKGDIVDIEKIKDLRKLTDGYDEPAGQPSLKSIMKLIEEKDLKVIATEDVGETKIAAQMSAGEKVKLIDRSLDGQKGYDFNFFKKMPDGDVKLLHLKLFKKY